MFISSFNSSIRIIDYSFFSLLISFFRYWVQLCRISSIFHRYFTSMIRLLSIPWSLFLLIILIVFCLFNIRSSMALTYSILWWMLNIFPTMLLETVSSTPTFSLMGFYLTTTFYIFISSTRFPRSFTVSFIISIWRIMIASVLLVSWFDSSWFINIFRISLDITISIIRLILRTAMLWSSII
jgi:hypothetical protein